MSFEIKYHVPLEKIDPLQASLSSYYLTDPLYPNNKICSVYYDTLDLKSISEKENSDFFKQKTRIRWYQSKDNQNTSKTFFETKSKKNQKRSKKRIEMTSFPTILKKLPLSDERWYLFSQDHIPTYLDGEEFRLPTLKITYQRLRFIEEETHTRIALDKTIQVESIHPLLQIKHFTLLPFKFGVLEIKTSKRQQIPPSIKTLLEFTTLKKKAISKYYEAYLTLHSI